MPNNESPFLSIPGGVDIAHYFIEEHLQDFDGQGCEGMALWRDGREYSYAWMECHIDHDLEQYFLLDIRTNVGQNETRDFLYVAIGVGMKMECEWHNQPLDFSASGDEHWARHRAGLTWFIDHALGEHDWSDK